MSREEALELVKSHVHRKNLFKHILAVESIMDGLAERLGEDAERWRMLGLLHDLDFDETFDKPQEHAARSCEMLEGKVDDELLRAIKSHNYEHTGLKPESKMEKALIAADAVSGLVVACALVMPSKKLADVTAESVARRLKERDFARNCSREHMLYCEQLGLEWKEFAELSLHALQKISKELEL
jgi:putative nucleotidyltransferase with HDIG domain